MSSEGDTSPTSPGLRAVAAKNKRKKSRSPKRNNQKSSPPNSPSSLKKRERSPQSSGFKDMMKKKDSSCDSSSSSKIMLDRIKCLVVKDKNCEGGMGIHFFDNHLHGGQWKFSFSKYDITEEKGRSFEMFDKTFAPFKKSILDAAEDDDVNKTENATTVIKSSNHNEMQHADENYRFLIVSNVKKDAGKIRVFENAVFGGDWIIQERLENSKELSEKLLPRNAPLSTFRIITASRGGLSSATQKETVHFQNPNSSSTSEEFVGDSGSTSISDHVNNRNSLTSNSIDIESLTCVFRAGRANAKTDHSSILYNVNILNNDLAEFGEITRGCTNNYWYHVGLNKLTDFKKEGCFTNKGVFWRPHGFEEAAGGIDAHPDDLTKVLKGEKLDKKLVKEMLDLCESAHRNLLPEVPLAGWDVAIVDQEVSLVVTTEKVEDDNKNHIGKKTGNKREDSTHKRFSIPVPVLLEANLSCNFFRGSFDERKYYDFLEDYVIDLESSSRG